MFDNDAHYARSRVLGTYMLPRDVNKDLVLIENIREEEGRGGNRLDRCIFYGHNHQTFREAELNYTIGELGYVDIPGEDTRFVSRIPKRNDWRQGLRASQLTTTVGGRDLNISSGWLHGNLRGFTKTLRGFYNPFLDVLEEIEEQGVAKPLSRRFALTGKFSLEYCGHKVGRLAKDETLSLTKKNDFLVQELEKAVGAHNVSKR